MTPMPLVVFDLETTSAEPGAARIVTAFLGVLDAAGNVVEELDLMVRPDGFVIPDEAVSIHGVSTEEALAHGIPLDDALEQILEFFYGHSIDLPLAGQNIPYDFTVLDRELRRARGAQRADYFVTWLAGRRVLDSLVIDKATDKWRKGSRQLTALAAHHGVELTADEAHGARADAIAAGRVVQKLLRHPALERFTLRKLHDAQVAWKRTQAASLQHYLRTMADPPQPDAVVSGEWPIIAHVDEEAAA